MRGWRTGPDSARLLKDGRRAARNHVHRSRNELDAQHHDWVDLNAGEVSIVTDVGGYKPVAVA